MWASQEAPAACSIEACCHCARLSAGRSQRCVDPGRPEQGASPDLEFIDELVPSARIEAQSRGVTLAVMRIDNRATIEADRQVLAAVLGNLLQNAFKCTRPRTMRCCGSARAPSACSSKCRMSAAASWVETSTSCSAHSSSAAATEPDLALGRVQPVGRRSEQRPVIRTQPAGQGMCLHDRSAANRGACHRHGGVNREAS